MGLFSQAANLPWRDFNWGYDVLTATAYRLWGLRAIPAFLMGFRVALAAITFLLAGGERSFWSAAALSTVAQYALSTMGPVAPCISVVFFGIELLLLFEIRKSGNLRMLFALAALFLFWGNLDIGFVYGIALYVLFLAALGFEKMGRTWNWQWIQRTDAEIPIGATALAGVACLAATVFSPYGYHAYAAFFTDQIDAVNRNLPSYTAMSFHRPQDYVLLLLTMAAFLSLGIRRSRDLFQICIMVACGALAFHAERENWLVTLPAVALIGQAIQEKGEEGEEQQGLQWGRQTFAAGAVAIALVAVTLAIRVPGKKETLLGKIGENYPVRACDFIHQNRLPSPLFNSYQWGSFLTWYLPEYLVAIDERRGLYPEKEEVDYFKAMRADIPYQAFPPMRQARTLLVDKVGVMGEALRGVRGFQVAYEDDISIVLLQEGEE